MLAAENGKRAVVVGAGIAGLTAAYRLQQSGWAVEVFEAEAAAGGRVETLEKQGYRIDTGATALAARYPIATQLANELDLEILWTAPYLGVYRDGRIHLLKLDRILRSGLSTKLLGWRTKIRLATVVADIVLASARGMLSYEDLRAAAPLDTETSSAYMRRMAGAEADTYFGEPVTRALLLANSDQVSRVELMSGLINAVAGRLSTVAGGQGAIIAKLFDRVKHVKLNTPVSSVAVSDDGVTVSYHDAHGQARSVNADACVLATQLPVAAQICGGGYPELARLNKALQFTQAINVAVGTTRPADTPAFLVQLPSVEDSDICMIIVENNKAPDRAPAGKGLISVSFEMSASARWIDRLDDEIVDRAMQTVYRLFPELRGTVDFTYVKRWRIALPHTKVGVYKQISEFAAGLDESSRLQFAGDYLSQTGQNTAVAWANRSAENIERHHGLKSAHRRAPQSG